MQLIVLLTLNNIIIIISSVLKSRYLDVVVTNV